MKEARFYNVLDKGSVRCTLCPHHCRLTQGKRGICLTRQNLGGALISLNYCRPVSMAVDPIEKKPLYHFHPGSSILSCGPNGCTFKCSFCQNCEISQEILTVREMPPDRFVKTILESDGIGIAYTYSEPYIWFETIMDVGKAVKKHGKKNVMVTNGFFEQEPLEELMEVVDALNIDIKSMSEEFYRRLCKGRLAPVLRACERVKARGRHLEITNLLIPGRNDSEEEVGKLVDFVAGSLGADTPLHFSRYFPRFRMSEPATPESTVFRACEIAALKLDFVYAGNVSAGALGHTRCPSCKATLVRRHGYEVSRTQDLAAPSGSQTSAHCAACGRPISIVM